MLRGTYAAATGMITQSQIVNVMANNLSNTQTPGYKKDAVSQTSFGNELVFSLKGGSQIGSYSAGTAAGAETTDVTQGPIEQTGISTDFALTKPGYFAVQGNGGTEYTRNGSFMVDPQGFLSTSAGQRVLGTNGPLHVGTDNFTVSEDGTITSGNQTVGKIAVYDGTATKQADGMFALAGAALTNSGVRQGCLESSNEDMVNAMTTMMMASRAYQSCRQAFKIADTSEQLTVNQVGSLK